MKRAQPEASASWPEAEMAAVAAVNAVNINRWLHPASRHHPPDHYISSLRVTCRRTVSGAAPAKVAEWDGSGHSCCWHYERAWDVISNNPAEIGPGLGNGYRLPCRVLRHHCRRCWYCWSARHSDAGPLFWLLAAVHAALLPVFFIIDYSAWLWWYGHRLNDMGAFSVKPFMPTVFGTARWRSFRPFLSLLGLRPDAGVERGRRADGRTATQTAQPRRQRLRSGDAVEPRKKPHLAVMGQPAGRRDACSIPAPVQAWSICRTRPTAHFRHRLACTRARWSSTRHWSSMAR